MTHGGQKRAGLAATPPTKTPEARAHKGQTAGAFIKQLREAAVAEVGRSRTAAGSNQPLAFVPGQYTIACTPSARILGERRRPGDPDAGHQVGLRQAAALRALGADEAAAREYPGEEVGQGCRVGRSNSSARPGTANQTESPVSHNDTSAPEATA